MVDDGKVAAIIADKIQLAYKLLDESAFEVRTHGSPVEADAYLQAVGPICADSVFRLMEPLYDRHPVLAPASWNASPEDLFANPEHPLSPVN